MEDEDFDRKAKAEAYAREIKRKELLSKGINIAKETIQTSELDRRLGVRRFKPAVIPKEEESLYKQAYEEKQVRVYLISEIASGH